MSLLVQYSDSESDVESDNESNICHKKIKLSEATTTGDEKFDKAQDTNRALLPLPDSIVNLFDKEKKHQDDPSQHGGRIRTFVHEKGNWATLVYIPYEEDRLFRDMIDELLLCLRPLEFTVMENFHVSLSRTVSIRHHWIETLTQSLQSKITSLYSFPLELRKLKVYTNDEKTRSFLAIEVFSPSRILTKYIKAVDQCFEEFKLQSYYKEPSFHISIGWCLNDVTSKITQEKMKELQNIWKTKCDEYPELKYFYVNKVDCKTGNKIFHFDVTDT